MKFNTQILIAALFMLTISCRKDPALISLSPEGNLLVLQIDNDYSIEKSAEFNIEVSSSNGKLDLDWYSAPNDYFTIRSESSGEAILEFKDNLLMTPELAYNSRIEQRDGRFFTKITPADFVSFNNEILSVEGLIEQVGDSKLLHGYFNQESGIKITIFPYLLREYDAELQISIPVRKFYLFCGL